MLASDSLARRFLFSTAALLDQYLKGQDPTEIFDSRIATPRLEEIFPNKTKARWRQRTSSACWAYDTPTREPVKKF